MNERGARIGWVGGGLGSLLFMPILSIVWLVQGLNSGAIAGFVCFLAGVVVLLLNAPWRFPTAKLRNLYLRFIVYYIAACVTVIYLGFPELRQPGQWLILVQLTPLLLILLTPVITMGDKTWHALHGTG